jgi:hypothetical protein
MEELISDDLPSPDSPDGAATSYFTAHLSLHSQRHRCKPVPCSCEPKISEAALLNLQQADLYSTDSGVINHSPIDTASLLKSPHRLHVVVTKTRVATGEVSLYGTASLDYRKVLCSGLLKVYHTLSSSSSVSLFALLN